ncbi:MAG TPA: efflux transporter outer membrane subunit [Terriglobales bacterium]|nr:efflux transporter outer membrane subunit [Terriglobales bacterium]
MIRKTSIVLVLFLAGCAVGPNYKRPQVAVPDAYRGLPADADKTSTASLADEKWWTLFQDEQLQSLIRAAIADNYDVRIAATRILQAQAVLGITRADQLPTITAGAAAVNERIPRSKTFPPIETSANSVNLAMVWELDFWGKYRRATEAARAQLLASEWAKRAVITSLVRNVASAYFQLRELDLELEISKHALASRQDSLRLVKIRASGGVTSMLDVRQSEQLVYEAAGQIPDLERRIEQQENFISILIGKNPEAIPRGKTLLESTFPPTVPAGLPSSLLERRADIQAAEQALVASNARIGVAKAAYFPQITLTGTAGYQSSALTSLFTGPAGAWSFGGQLLQPVFEGGRLRSGVRLAEAQKEELLLIYQQAIQEAFREVSDALVGYKKDQEFREQQDLLTRSAQDATALSQSRYSGGVTSYLEVLDSDTRYFAAQLTLAQAQLNERLSLVQLYGALGGGWQQ